MGEDSLTPYARRSSLQVSFFTHCHKKRQLQHRQPTSICSSAGGRTGCGQSPQLMQFGSLFRKRSHAHLPFLTIDSYTVLATQLYLT